MASNFGHFSFAALASYCNNIANSRVANLFFRLSRGNFIPILFTVPDLLRRTQEARHVRADRAMTYTPQHVANYFLDRAEAENSAISPLKLLKLVYIAYGWHLAITAEQLFREQIEAWQHGPVVPSIYHEFKHFGSGPIAGKSVTIDFSASKPGLSPEFVIPRIPQDDKTSNAILDNVWRSYSPFSGWQLRDMTHQADTPWSRVYVAGSRGIKLKDEDIRGHYIQRINRYIEAARQNAGQPVTADP